MSVWGSENEKRMFAIGTMLGAEHSGIVSIKRPVINKIEGMATFTPILLAEFFPTEKTYDMITERANPLERTVYGWGNSYKDSLGYFEVEFNRIYPLKNKYSVTDTINEFTQYIDFSLESGSKYITRVYYTYSPYTQEGTFTISVVDTTTNSVKVSATIGTLKVVSLGDSARYDIIQNLGNAFVTTHSVYIDGCPISLSFKYQGRWYSYQSPYSNGDIALDSSPFSGLTSQILEVGNFIYTTGMTSRKTYTVSNSTTGLSRQIVAITDKIGVIIE